MPDPYKYNDRQEFISDCISESMEEGYSQEQAQARCINWWEATQQKSFYRHLLRDKLQKYHAKIRKDVYDELESELKQLLKQKWQNQTKQALNEALQIVQAAPQGLNANVTRTVLQRLSILLGEEMVKGIRDGVGKALQASYQNGKKGITGVKPTLNKIDNKALAAINRFNMYWIGNHYDRQLRGRIQRLAEQSIKQGQSRRQRRRLFQKGLGRQFNRSLNYWDLVGTNAVNRSRELGRISGYETAGVDFYRVSAVLDHRTSQICKNMHGRVIHISKGIKLRNALVQTQNPEQVKNVAPWPSPSEIVAKQTSQLSLGMGFPPYHGHCRTRTVADTAVEERNAVRQINYPSNMSRAERNRIGMYNKKEYSNWLQTMRGRDELPLSPGFAKQISAGKAAISGNEMQAVRKSVSRSNKAYVGYKDDMKFQMLSDNYHVTVDRGNTIIDAKPASAGTAGALSSHYAELSNESTGLSIPGV